MTCASWVDVDDDVLAPGDMMAGEPQEFAAVESRVEGMATPSMLDFIKQGLKAIWKDMDSRFDDSPELESDVCRVAIKFFSSPSATPHGTAAAHVWHSKERQFGSLRSELMKHVVDARDMATACRDFLNTANVYKIRIAMEHFMEMDS